MVNSFPSASKTGPLTSIRVLEFAGLGPTPFAAMMLADMGASIVRIERPHPPERLDEKAELDTLRRGRGSVRLNLKDDRHVAIARNLAARADVVLEGFRPGVMERLGLGADLLTLENPKLVYARMTGWGQEGPLAQRAGHDINYISLTGALLAMGKEGSPPPPPLNLIGDFGGGGMLIVVGILSALLERGVSGRGQVIDAAMVDGTTLLLAQVSSWRAMGLWSDRRGANLLDGGAYFYRCYTCADGGFVAVGALEQQFHDNLVHALELDLTQFRDRLNSEHWQARSRIFEDRFSTKTRDEWAAVFQSIDACVTPVLSMDEAPSYPSNAARQMHLDASPASAPQAAPRFSRTSSKAVTPSVDPFLEGIATLRSWGVDSNILEAISDEGGRM